jgi:23S rRNA C2498 (ribose-2'-O)-methylase RlmM
MTPEDLNSFDQIVARHIRPIHLRLEVLSEQVEELRKETADTYVRQDVYEANRQVEVTLRDQRERYWVRLVAIATVIATVASVAAVLK